MQWPLLNRIPDSEKRQNADLALESFLDYVREKEIELYPAQEEAILELYSGKNLILNTPTGSGKSLVAAALHFESLWRGRRSYYTCPIKALVNEKFLALCKDFGPDQVGMVTGDASVNPDAPIICCTAEILSNLALREGSRAKVDDVIMDEFHYYSDRERGVAWQIPLLSMPQSRFLLMSATLGETTFFEKCLTELTGKDTSVVRSMHRPVPLDFEYSEDAIHEVIPKLVRAGKSPIYLVNFTQRECAEQAQDLLSVDFATKEEKRAIADELEGFKFSSPYGKDLIRIIKHGIGIHHAGLLPKYRILMERLAQKGMLKIICGTDTLGVGVNVPIRTVLFTKLCKFDGEKVTILSVRDFQQISGRAGRKGFDDRGTVVVQAPEHVIENIKLEQKAAGDAKKLKKLVKRKPPEKGYLPWTKETFQKLVGGQPEQLASRFKVSHGMLLNVLGREGEDGCRAMHGLIRKSHESANLKKRHGKMAFQLFRSLVERKIIELNPLRLHVDLQDDFSLHQTLSLYLIDAVQILDPAHPEYALDVLTLVESILENPDLILRKQLDRVKTDKMHEMKMAGVEFDERIAELENLEWPKPNRDFIYRTFNEFAERHPWVGQDNIRPKSIAREMFEGFHSFPEYVREYGLQRVEGLLLRYLSEVYKALVQTVPGYAKNEELYEMTVYFGAMIRQIDSSLLDEWEKMRNPAWVKAEVEDPAASKRAEMAEKDVTWDRKAFTVMVRNVAFQVVKELSRRSYESVFENLGGSDLTSDQLKARLEEYFVAGHSRIRVDSPARAANFCRMTPSEDQKTWAVQQILVDTDGHNDWAVDLLLDLDASRQAGGPVLKLLGVASL